MTSSDIHVRCCPTAPEKQRRGELGCMLTGGNLLARSDDGVTSRGVEHAERIENFGPGGGKA